jgi:hypothetical protein
MSENLPAQTPFLTPILFLIFNRPDITKLVFDVIRDQRPKFLFIAADGPRINKAGEIVQCEITRKTVLENIDWDCEVKTLFRNGNLGCGRAVSQAISWFFENVEEGIILEDDCLPDPSFFKFCQETLRHFREDDRIMHIGGSNFQSIGRTSDYSYYFSNYIHVWGWATWRRAWKMYLYNIPPIDDQFKSALNSMFTNRIEKSFWINSFEQMVSHYIDTWDIQWVYSIYSNSGIGVTPSVNLISNIGFGAEATHTNMFDPISAELPLNSINEIKHQPSIRVFRRADRYSFQKLFKGGDTNFNRFKFQLGQKMPLIKTIYLKLFK